MFGNISIDIVWEKANGSIPQKIIVIFADGENKENLKFKT